MENCIICGGKIIRNCKCMRGDSTCENGHNFHWSPYHKEYHLGISDHSTPTDSENCCERKIVIDEKNKQLVFEDHTRVNFEDKMVTEPVNADTLIDISSVSPEELANFLKDNEDVEGTLIYSDDIDSTLIDCLKDPMTNLVDACDIIDTDNIAFSFVFPKPELLDEDFDISTEERVKKYLENAQIVVAVDGLSYNLPMKYAKDDELVDIFSDSMFNNYMGNQLYQETINVIYERKVIDYCNKNNMQTAEGLIPGDSDIYTFEDFDREYPLVADKLYNEAIEEAKFVAPKGSTFGIIE